jgi:long-chain acyl-CoA synthetase
MFDATAGAHRAHPAIVQQRHVLAYDEVRILSERLAEGLCRASVGPGARVAVLIPNAPELPWTLLGIMRAGCIAVPLSLRLAPPEIAACLRNAAAEAVLLASHRLWPDLARHLDGQLPRVVALPGELTGQLDAITTTGQIGLNASSSSIFDHRESTALAVILYTSGTTGKPKGVALSHRALSLNANLLVGECGFLATDVLLTTVPLCHAFGFTDVINGCFASGATMYVVERPSPKEILSYIAEGLITILPAVPTTLFDLLKEQKDHPQDLRRSRLRLVITGGAPVGPERTAATAHVFGCDVLEGYGLTETSPTVSINRPQYSRLGSVGQPLPGVEVRIANSDDSGTGEILVRGHCLFDGYWDDERSTAEAFDGEWFKTGDIGHLDEAGYLSIVGRKKDMIIRAGMKVYPSETERVLLLHPSIEDAVVVGLPDERLGQAIGAVVVPRRGDTVELSDVQAFCRVRLAKYKWPERLVCIPDMPLGGTGKIRRRELISFFSQVSKSGE